MAEFFQDNWYWLLIGLAALVVVLLLVIEGMVRKNKKRKNVEAETGVVENKNIRLSKDTEQFDKEGNVQVTVAHQDLIVSRGQTLTAGTGKGADIKPGKYTVLAAVEGQNAFNIRVGGFVREIKHGAVVVLAEGDTICPTSTSIVLR